jgi:ADP-heptose:LPS heptosyltransferase
MKRETKHELLSDETTLDPTIFREGTKAKDYFVNYMLAGAGLGDYIGYLTALRYIASHSPNIHGRVFSPDFFIPIAENVLKSFAPRWKVEPKERFTKARATDSRSRYFGPYDEPISRIGCNSVDLGFIYYNHQCPAPADHSNYVELDLSSTTPHPEAPMVQAPSTATPYVVLTPVSTYSNRRMSAEVFNGVIDWLTDHNYTPVLLGADNFDKRSLTIMAEYKFSKCINLINKTSLLQAAKVLDGAQAIIAVDNGLTHLAATTKCPNLFVGYTVSSPTHAKPRPVHGTVWDIHVPKSQLSCMFCQSEMRNMGPHDFKACIYGDDACSKILTAQDWISHLEGVL